VGVGEREKRRRKGLVKVRFSTFYDDHGMLTNVI
jgi:hypothetical protein